jgi:hypothetical protein
VKRPNQNKAITINAHNTDGEETGFDRNISIEHYRRFVRQEPIAVCTCFNKANRDTYLIVCKMNYDSQAYYYEHYDYEPQQNDCL